MEIKDIHDFQDVMCCALRYALGRKTYITSVIPDFIKSYEEVIDNRVKEIMLRDLNQYFVFRESGYQTDDECDYNSWKDLANWLINL